MRSERGAPRGHAIYLAFIAALPEAWEPRLRGAADQVRRGRRPVRLFRQRRVRRFKRSLRRTERRLRRTERRVNRVGRRTRRLGRHIVRFVRRSIRSARNVSRKTLLRPARTLRSDLARSTRSSERRRQRARSGAMFGDGSKTSPGVSDDFDHPQAEPEAVVLGKRNWLTKRLFPPVITLPGTGPIVLVDALGASTAEILAALPQLNGRSIIATNDPNVGPLRSVGAVYEYVPVATPDGCHESERLNERIMWIDYIYGIEEIRRLSDST